MARPADRKAGAESFELGPALRRRNGVRRHGHVGRPSGRARWRCRAVPGADRRRRGQTRTARDPARSPPRGRHRRRTCRRSSTLACRCATDERGQRGRPRHPRHEGADRRARAKARSPVVGLAADASLRVLTEIEGGAVPGAQPQQPGSTELPDQAEQPAGGAAAERRDGRRAADRRRLRRVQGAVGRTRRPAASASVAWKATGHRLQPCWPRRRDEAPRTARPAAAEE